MPEETTLLSWRIHRLRDEPGRIVGIAAAYAVAIVLWRFFFPSPLALFLPIIALTSALAEFLLPVEYRLTDQGAYACCGPLSRLYLPWTDVRRATWGADGVHLSPLVAPSRLDSFRGIRLRCAPESAPLGTIRETVREQLQRVRAIGESAS
jgi:hypothetical protein